jgi:hypothetical protein
MNASKENAQKAYRFFHDLVDDAMKGFPFPRDGAEMRDFIHDFLTAAERKLPSEAAYDRSKKRPAPRLTNRGAPGTA